ARLPRRVSADGGRRPAAAEPGRDVAALAAALSDRRRDARPPDAAAGAVLPAGAPAPPLPARRAADRARRGRLDARRLPDAPAPDAGRARRLRHRLPDVRRGDRSLLPRREGRLGTLVRAAGRRSPPLGRAHG